MLAAYRTAAAERQKQGIPPLPLDPKQTAEVCRLLESASPEAAELKALLLDRVSPGVDPSAKVKAEWLGKVAHGEVACPVITRAEAIIGLGQMLGGYNTPFLTRELDGPNAQLAADQLAKMVLIFDNFVVVAQQAASGNAIAAKLIQRWAAAEWFTSRPEIEAEVSGVVYKITPTICRRRRAR